MESDILALLQPHGHCRSNRKQNKRKQKHTNKTLLKMAVTLRYTLYNPNKPLQMHYTIKMAHPCLTLKQDFAKTVIQGKNPCTGD